MCECWVVSWMWVSALERERVCVRVCGDVWSDFAVCLKMAGEAAAMAGQEDEVGRSTR